MKTAYYRIAAEMLDEKMRIALVSNLHNNDYRPIIDELKKIKPDIIAMTGDLTSRLDCNEGEIAPCDDGRPVTHISAFALLNEAALIAPTYYSLGNHELCGHYGNKNKGRKITKENLAAISRSKAVLLDDSYVTLPNGIRIGGLTDGMTNQDTKPNTGWLDGFESGGKYRILLCHHPEYYDGYVKDRQIELMLSGHAHGGQIRLFGIGLMAPDQGIFPKYTKGVYDNRLVVSAGLSNTGGIIPRLFNPKEIVVIDIN